MSKVQITTKGIMKVLQKYKYYQAIAEYIWNGFDANATNVKLNYEVDEFDTVISLSITDNGYGIVESELQNKFVPFYDSEKFNLEKSINEQNYHGKKGVGRLTFFSFCEEANWETIYEIDNKNYLYNISINNKSLDAYHAKNKIETELETGTTVSFEKLNNLSGNQFDEELLLYLIKEFGWYLKLFPQKSLFINNKTIDIQKNINETVEKEFKNPKTNSVFKIIYIQWKEKINNQFSRYYFLDDIGNRKHDMTTTLNNKGDNFYHSVYVNSIYFREFVYQSQEDNQAVMLAKSRKDDDFKFIKNEIDNFIYEKRKPFLNAYSSKLIMEFEKEKVFPEHNISDKYELYKYNDLKHITKELYKAKPSLFTSLNLEQKKIFLKFLDVLLESDERDNLIEILDNILELETNEKIDFLNIIKKSKLSNIIRTLKLIEDRYKAVENLKEMVFNKDLNANEVHHLQYIIEQHYWIFGEQYQLLTSCEEKFETALRKYLYLLTEKDEVVEIQHPHKLKEMDIFACRQNIANDRIENIVVELKHPLINLGSKQYNQVYNYMELILKQPKFNASNMNWEFYLIGNKFDNTDFIKNQIKTNKPHGINSLMLLLEDGRVKYYAKTWSEIFNDFEIKHKYIQEKLQLQRNKLIEDYQNANDIIIDDKSNTAHSLVELTFSNNK